MNDEKGTVGEGLAERASEEEIHLPKPTIWPAVCGIGIGLTGFGVVTSSFFSAIGLLVIAWSLVGWIGELRHD